MWKVVQMLQNFVRFVKRIFSVEMPMASVEARLDGQSKLPAATVARSSYVGGGGFIRRGKIQVPRVKRVMEHAPRAKLTFQMAETIRKLSHMGWTVPELANQYKVCGETIRKLLAGRTWQRDLGVTCPPRHKQCAYCRGLILDRIDGVRIHPRNWAKIRFCSELCAASEIP